MQAGPRLATRQDRQLAQLGRRLTAHTGHGKPNPHCSRIELANTIARAMSIIARQRSASKEAVMRFAGAIVLVVGGWAGVVSPAAAQTPLDDSVNAATQVLREIMAVPLKCIPEGLLHEAHGIAIVPGMVKGGFIVGVRH